MDRKEKKQKLDTSGITSLSLSKMHLKFKKKKKTKKQKNSENHNPSLSKNKDLVISSPSLSKIDVRQVMKKQNDVAMLLARKAISAVAKNSNFVFSPVSISAVLTMVAASCDEESEELRSFILSFLRSSSTDELNAVFHEIASFVLVDGRKKGGPKIAVVNGVWMEQSLPVSPSLKDIFENFFKAAFEQVDFRTKVSLCMISLSHQDMSKSYHIQCFLHFPYNPIYFLLFLKAEQVRMEVNSWASRHTNGLIKNLLPHGSVTRLTDRIHGTALYFKGSWEKKFHKSMTERKPFYLVNGTTVSVPFMSSSHKQYIESYNGFKVLSLPYRQDRDEDTDRGFSMYFYLPDMKDGLDNLLKRMSSTPGFLDSHIPKEKVKVGEFRIPKFKIESGFEASSYFNNFVLDVSMYQKVFIEIDEEGTEAYACTDFHVPYNGCSWVRPIDFVADHPFVFLIREYQTGTVLFAGQIFDPSA
ncbi:probable non-inhibitory serpin-Z5 isoform X1 [Capsella rubella]|uniref:probable non-inhibitory serpin-Z5 isoform X1 n=1 Tax=Capsella rubella TaxID=81985 RepID=UPI000CD5A433|nr:probable non-inhibitory serpin-Z5 isoform X1 [Capsella rubella]